MIKHKHLLSVFFVPFLLTFIFSTNLTAADNTTLLVKQLASPKQIDRWAAEVELWSVEPTEMPTIALMLNDTNQKIRIAAAEALWHIRDKKAIPLLKQALEDPDPTVKDKIAEVLKRFEPAIQSKLVKSGIPPNLDFDILAKKLSSKDEKTRAEAMRNIPNNTDDRLFNLATQLIRDKNKQVAFSAASILCHYTDGRSDPYLLEAWKRGNGFICEMGPSGLTEYPGAAKLALIMIKDSNPLRREEAVNILSDLKSPECLDALKSAMNDKSAEVRESAASGLGELGDSSAIPLLLQALQDKDQDVIAYAAFSLGELKSHEAVHPLIKLLSNKKDDDSIRESSARALNMIGDPRAIPSLLKCLNDQNIMLKEAVIEALGSLHAKEAVAPLCNILKDKDEYVRSVAASSLGEIGDPTAGDALIALLKDPVKNVHSRAMVALAKLKDKRAYDILVNTAEKCDMELGFAAVEGLGILGDTRAVPHIIPYLANTYLPRALTVVSALSSLGDKRAVKPLIAAITKGWSEPSGHVICDCMLPDTGIAARGLMELNNPEGNEFLMNALYSKDIQVIKGAYRFYISQGVEGSEELLISLLKYNEILIAIDFINSDNHKLVEAGQKSIKNNPDLRDCYYSKYKLNSPKWGSKEPIIREQLQ